MVTMCVCANRSFAELVRLAREQGWDLAELAAATGATRGCGLCRPYVIEALASGQTVFPLKT